MAGLEEFLSDEELMEAMSVSDEERDELNKIRFLGSIIPTKDFYVRALNIYRRQKKERGARE